MNDYQRERLRSQVMDAASRELHFDSHERLTDLEADKQARTRYVAFLLALGPILVGVVTVAMDAFR